MTALLRAAAAAAMARSVCLRVFVCVCVLGVHRGWGGAQAWVMEAWHGALAHRSVRRSIRQPN